MPEDLLLELEASPPVAGSLENIEDLLRVITRQACWVTEGMKGSAAIFENAWRHMVLSVAKGQTAEVHAARPRLASAFQKRLDLLKQTHTLLTWLHKRGRTDLPEPDALLAEIAGMERLKARVIDPWQSVEDLEDLAARDYPLTSSDLDAIGARHRPATSWYAEEGKPF
jgi:hypothetical protein